MRTVRKVTQPMYISIQQEATGKHMRQLFQQKGYTVKDVQTAMGFENPQAVYKWLSGQTLPSIDSLIVLSRLLHVSIEEILVVDGDFVVLEQNYKKKNPRCDGGDFVVFWDGHSVVNGSHNLGFAVRCD